ncbi:MAG: class I SAM-dependent methyltransferase [Theionarchaea archaeon]|nr:class I SAM-dependent methyltransferase [Theionarchaea archaeon]MBU7038874.1 class I SAM-dependent methyltransferase [Theionarchaea archaeon]
MNVTREWDEAAEAWAAFVRTGKDYYRDELNNPAMFDMLGSLSGRKILDAACGEGYNTRLMAKKGAVVTGVDSSEAMISLALQEEEKEPLGIEYVVADVCNLNVFKRRTFDIVTCFMALQDIELYIKAIQEIWRVLIVRGRFLAVIPHPCFEKRRINDKIIGGWEYPEGASHNESPHYYKVDHYFETCSYSIHWNMARLAQHFVTTAFHRTVTEYFDALNTAGFLVSRLKEPRPRHPIHPHLVLELRIPQSLIIEAVKL